MQTYKRYSDSGIWLPVHGRNTTLEPLGDSRVTVELYENLKGSHHARWYTAAALSAAGFIAGGLKWWASSEAAPALVKALAEASDAVFEQVSTAVGSVADVVK